jgi:hypothetical protein
MRSFRFVVILTPLIFLGVVLASCSRSSEESRQAAGAASLDAVAPTETVAKKENPPEGLSETGGASPSQEVEGNAWPDGRSQRDGQGAVEVDIQPLNLNQVGEMLEFEVSLNTHSVDLDMDLAELARLSTDDGQAAAALLWDSPRGGHHLTGTLSFPAYVDGLSLLDGATKLTLTLENLDVPLRTFVWERQ